MFFSRKEKAGEIAVWTALSLLLSFFLTDPALGNSSPATKYSVSLAVSASSDPMPGNSPYAAKSSDSPTVPALLNPMPGNSPYAAKPSDSPAAPALSNPMLGHFPYAAKSSDSLAAPALSNLIPGSFPYAAKTSDSPAAPALFNPMPGNIPFSAKSSDSLNASTSSDPMLGNLTSAAEYSLFQFTSDPYALFAEEEYNEDGTDDAFDRGGRHYPSLSWSGVARDELPLEEVLIPEDPSFPGNGDDSLAEYGDDEAWLQEDSAGLGSPSAAWDPAAFALSSSEILAAGLPFSDSPESKSYYYNHLSDRQQRVYEAFLEAGRDPASSGIVMFAEKATSSNIVSYDEAMEAYEALLYDEPEAGFFRNRFSLRGTSAEDVRGVNYRDPYDSVSEYREMLRNLKNAAEELLESALPTDGEMIFSAGASLCQDLEPPKNTLIDGTKGLHGNGNGAAAAGLESAQPEGILMEDAQGDENLMAAGLESAQPEGILMQDALSPEDYALRVHDALINKVTYRDDGSMEAHSAYGALVGGSAVCDGYAYAYKLLLEMAGIPCLFIPGMGNGVPHAWNLVMLDGEWYEVDATWDDSRMESARHRYYNITTEEMGKDHSRKDRGPVLYAPLANGQKHAYHGSSSADGSGGESGGGEDGDNADGQGGSNQEASGQKDDSRNGNQKGGSQESGASKYGSQKGGTEKDAQKDPGQENKTQKGSGTGSEDGDEDDRTDTKGSKGGREQGRDGRKDDKKDEDSMKGDESKKEKDDKKDGNNNGDEAGGKMKDEEKDEEKDGENGQAGEDKQGGKQDDNKGNGNGNDEDVNEAGGSGANDEGEGQDGKGRGDANKDRSGSENGDRDGNGNPGGSGSRDGSVRGNERSDGESRDPATALFGDWKRELGGWRYYLENGNGSFAAGQWALIRGSWYYFGLDGYMLTGWHDIGGQWYYLETQGPMEGAWVKGAVYPDAVLH